MAREKAIEDQWDKEETRLREGEELEGLREEARQLSEKLENALAEAKYHREKGDRLSQAHHTLRTLRTLRTLHTLHAIQISLREERPTVAGASRTRCDRT